MFHPQLIHHCARHGGQSVVATVKEAIFTDARNRRPTLSIVIYDGSVSATEIVTSSSSSFQRPPLRQRAMHPPALRSPLDSIILIKALIKSILSRTVTISTISWLMQNLDKGWVNNRYQWTEFDYKRLFIGCVNKLL